MNPEMKKAAEALLQKLNEVGPLLRKHNPELRKTTLGGSNLQFSFPLVKVDKNTGVIRGIATSELIDKTGEVLTYAGSKVAFKNWLGNIREQHDPHKAVGKAVEIEFNDAKKEIVVTARISKAAPDTLTKVHEGILRFFSVGGRRVRSEVKDAASLPERFFRAVSRRPKQARITQAWEMNELSLVDAPALPVARFELVKMVNGRPALCLALYGRPQDLRKQLEELKGALDTLQRKVAKSKRS